MPTAASCCKRELLACVVALPAKDKQAESCVQAFLFRARLPTNSRRKARHAGLPVFLAFGPSAARRRQPSRTSRAPRVPAGTNKGKLSQLMTEGWEMKRSTCWQLVLLICVAGACGLQYRSRSALDPVQEGVYHACQLYQDLHYLFFEEHGHHRITRLFIDPTIPWGDWNMVIDYRFLTSLPDLRELSIASHVISNAELNMLSRVKGLTLLDLRGCEGFSEFTLKELQRKRPDIRILYGKKLTSLDQLPLRERQAAADAEASSRAGQLRRKPVARWLREHADGEPVDERAPAGRWGESSPK